MLYTPCDHLEAHLSRITTKIPTWRWTCQWILECPLTTGQIPTASQTTGPCNQINRNTNQSPCYSTYQDHIRPSSTSSFPTCLLNTRKRHQLHQRYCHHQLHSRTLPTKQQAKIITTSKQSLPPNYDYRTHCQYIIQLKTPTTHITSLIRTYLYNSKRRPGYEYLNPMETEIYTSDQDGTSRIIYVPELTMAIHLVIHLGKTIQLPSGSNSFVLCPWMSLVFVLSTVLPSTCSLTNSDFMSCLEVIKG